MSDSGAIKSMVDQLVERAEGALGEFMKLDQDAIDRIVKEAALAGLDKQTVLAKAAVEETGRGVLEDKVIKNIFSTEYIYHSIKYEKTAGVIEDNENEGYMEVAEPVGIVAGVTPVTNPTSTTMFKALICLKTRNPIIFAFHPSSQKCSVQAARLLRDAAVAAGAPEWCIQWVDEPSVEATNALMRNPGIALILATGGSSMVKSAYSCGKPALGVGPGNVPCYIHKSANIKRSVTDLIMSKTFDNGMICASEQAVIIDREIAPATIAYMKEMGCYFVEGEEKERLEHLIKDEERGSLNAAIVGQSAARIAEMAGFSVPPGTKILVGIIDGVGDEYPLSMEKLSPVLAAFIVEDFTEGIRRADEMVRYGGLGHSACIHAEDEAVIELFSQTIKTGRLLVNAPSTHGAIGDLYNTNMPSLTLGCGSYGHNSTTANVTAVNLLNKKRVARRRHNMQWFKVPDRIYFEPGSIQYLEKMPDITRALIVTDPMMVKLGYVERALYYLRKRREYVHSEIFDGVEPDPSVETVMRGAEVARRFQPDVIIAIGGGSSIDAAKGIWLFYEHPDVDFEAMTMKFMDIRKRIYKLPTLGKKAQFVAIPTTSGTGSEVTSFTVITDKKTGRKYPIADYELTPDVAIIDPSLVMSVPPAVTADTGVDVLTHAIEAYVSVMASDYTDALAMKAAQIVFEYLPAAFKNGNDKVARGKMHNASTMAGMAFTNAFLGVNHSLAHTLGAEFHVPHGRANAIMLPHVIRYNGGIPTKITSFPKYEYYMAPEKYTELAHGVRLLCGGGMDGAQALAAAVGGLMTKLNMPLRIRDCGIDEKEFELRVRRMAELAFEDQCTTANPRMPLIDELEALYRAAW